MDDMTTFTNGDHGARICHVTDAQGRIHAADVAGLTDEEGERHSKAQQLVAIALADE